MKEQAQGFDGRALRAALRRAAGTQELRPPGLPVSVWWRTGLLSAESAAAWLEVGQRGLAAMPSAPGRLASPLVVGDGRITGWLPSPGGSTRIASVYVEGPCVEALRDRIARLTGAPMSHLLPDVRIRRYRDTYSGWHWDVGRDALATVVVFLQDLPRSRGGATVYRDEAERLMRLAVEPTLGAAVVHVNLLDDGAVDRRWKHASAPVVGDKWVVIVSVLGRPARDDERELSTDLAQRETTASPKGSQPPGCSANIVSRRS